MDSRGDGDPQITQRCVGGNLQQAVLAKLEAVQGGRRTLEGRILAHTQTLGTQGIRMRTRRVLDCEQRISHFLAATSS